MRQRASMDGQGQGSSVVLVSIVTSLLTAASATYLIGRYQLFSPPERQHQVLAPPLVGLSEADARANAQALQLPLLVEGREPAPGAPPGSVVRQAIAPGQPVPAGTPLRVVFAASWSRVPKLVDLPLADAERALAHEGFELRAGEAVPDPSIPVGHVARQVPEPDVALEPGGTVVVNASSGPAEVETPKLTGMALGAATDTLTQAHLTPVVRWISKAETVTGIVLSQKPEAGQKVAPSASVEVVVNR